MEDKTQDELKLYGPIHDAERGEFGERGQRASEDLSPQMSLLVVSGHKSPFKTFISPGGYPKPPSGFKSSWSRTQKHLYHRILSGIEMARRSNDYLRVLTLTSSSDSGDFHRDFEVLKKRIRRKFGKFEYIAVKEHTKEGLVHLHMVYRGCFMPQSWLSDQWNEIHGAKIVWIAKLYTWKLAKHLARYFIKEGFGRYWTSWVWVYKGFVRDWKRLVHEKGDMALAYWHRWLRSWTPVAKMFQLPFSHLN